MNMTVKFGDALCERGELGKQISDFFDLLFHGGRTSFRSQMWNCQENQHSKNELARERLAKTCHSRHHTCEEETWELKTRRSTNTGMWTIGTRQKPRKLATQEFTVLTRVRTGSSSFAVDTELVDEVHLLSSCCIYLHWV